MEAYPEDYVAYNRPFILLSGLEAESSNAEPGLSDDYYPLLHEEGVKIDSDFPPLGGSIAGELRDVLLENDASGSAGSSQNVAKPTKTRNSKTGFKIKSIGRVGGFRVFALRASVSIGTMKLLVFVHGQLLPLVLENHLLTIG